jgi:hypothetical protein
LNYEVERLPVGERGRQAGPPGADAS